MHPVRHSTCHLPISLGLNITNRSSYDVFCYLLLTSNQCFCHSPTRRCILTSASCILVVVEVERPLCECLFVCKLPLISQLASISRAISFHYPPPWTRWESGTQLQLCGPRSYSASIIIIL